MHTPNIQRYRQEDRLILEKNIIGSCLIEGQYIRIAHILKPKNFSTKEHEIIWKAFGEMYPSQLINLPTTNKHLRNTNPDYNRSFAILLAEYQNSVFSTGSLEYDCYSLLEYDISAKFSSDLVQYNKSCNSEQIRDSLCEIYAKITSPNEDLLELIEDSFDYFTSYYPDDPFTRIIEQYNTAILAKAEGLKSPWTMQMILNELLKRVPGDWQKNVLIKHLFSQISNVIDSRTISTEHLKLLTTTT
jgi:hypothetical protein